MSIHVTRAPMVPLTSYTKRWSHLNGEKILLKQSNGLISVMGTAPGKSTIIDWYAEFKRGRTNTEVAQNQQLFRQT